MPSKPSNHYYYKKKNSRRRKKDTTIRPFKPVYIIIPAIAVAAIAAALILLLRPEEPKAVTKYLASSSSGVPYFYYNEDENRLIRSSRTIPRGTRVLDMEEHYYENGLDYVVVDINGETFYMIQKNLVDDPAEIVQETRVWVRTACTIYKNQTGAEISSAAKKGDCLEVTGYDTMDIDGNINKYSVRFTDAAGENVTGWVYGKYMVSNEADALAVNRDTYEIHKNRVYSGKELYGGLPTNLDWYPVKKPAFPENPILETASAMYINIDATSKIDKYIEIAKNNGVNAVVVNIKEDIVAFPCEEIKDICPWAYENAYYATPEQYKAVIQKCKDAGLYCIGRIVAFKDSVFAFEQPKECIESSVSSMEWPSAYSRLCWYYNLALAKAAVKLCGFNEIQFDYVRFPETAYRMSSDGDTDFKNRYNEEKAQAIQNFCFYACDVLHEDHVYVSIDVFGECANTYITAYGQYYPAISLVVDAISGMPYPDHYSREEDTWTDPYPIMYDWGSKVVLRRSEIPTPAIDRVWVAAYNVPFWNPVVTCDDKYIAAEVQGLVNAGITGGFITWSGDSNLKRYELIAPAWNKTYVPS